MHQFCVWQMPFTASCPYLCYMNLAEITDSLHMCERRAAGFERCIGQLGYGVYVSMYFIPFSTRVHRTFQQKWPVKD